MTAETLKSWPVIQKVVDANIDPLLKSQKRFILWRAGAFKINGKFDKIPIDPLTQDSISALDPANWLSYEEALAQHRNGIGSGIGFVLSADAPITFDGRNLFFVALDFDNCAA